MIQLILDSLRRWWWVLALLAGLEGVLGWLLATNPEQDFEFWALTLALWPCGVMLPVDLQRGLARAVAILPVTSRQIGRSWWLGMVIIPAIVLAIPLWLGAAFGCHLKPNLIFPVRAIVMTNLFTLLWLGAAFASIYGISRSFLESTLEHILSMILGILSTVMTFGSLLYAHGAARDSVKAAILILLGTVLTLAGWLRAEGFALGRASLRRVPPYDRSRQGQCGPPRGPGAIGFLIRTCLMRSVSTAAAAVLLTAALMWWQGGGYRPAFFLPMFASMTSGLCSVLVIMLHVMPLVRELRHLRTLPISTHRLALVLVGVALLPLLILGGLTGVAAVVLSGLPAAMTIWKAYLFVLAPTSLCVLVGLWQGQAVHAYVWMLFFVIGSTAFYSWLRPIEDTTEPTALLVATISTGVLLVAFLLTRRIITHSSHAYRPQAAILSVWGMTD